MGEKVNVEALRALRVIECKNGQPWNKAGTKKKRASAAASLEDGTTPQTLQEAETRGGGATTMGKQPKKKRQSKRENSNGDVGSKAKKKTTKRPRTGEECIEPSINLMDCLCTSTLSRLVWIMGVMACSYGCSWS